MSVNFGISFNNFDNVFLKKKNSKYRIYTMILSNANVTSSIAISPDFSPPALRPGMASNSGSVDFMNDFTVASLL